jgi:hypothetical protein
MEHTKTWRSSERSRVEEFKEELGKLFK